MKNTLSDRLNYLTTIAEEQSITRAATRLFISQPALTAFLSRTEEELGTRLFDRTSTPIRITEAGAYYLSELEKICVMQDRLHQELADFSADDQELRLNVGIGRNRGSIWLSSVMPELYRLYPDMLLTIFEDRDTNMLDKVLNGGLDVAIVETYAYHSDLHCNTGRRGENSIPKTTACFGWLSHKRRTFYFPRAAELQKAYRIPEYGVSGFNVRYSCSVSGNVGFKDTGFSAAQNLTVCLFHR